MNNKPDQDEIDRAMADTTGPVRRLIIKYYWYIIAFWLGVLTMAIAIIIDGKG